MQGIFDDLRIKYTPESTNIDPDWLAPWKSVGSSTNQWFSGSMLVVF